MRKVEINVIDYSILLAFAFIGALTIGKNAHIQWIILKTFIPNDVSSIGGDYR